MNITCPECDGHKQVIGFVCGENVKFNVRQLDCSTCKGTGEITEAHQNAIRQGRVLSELRIHVAPYLSQRDAAALLGFDIYGYSRLEHGDPELWAQHGERVLSTLRTLKEVTL